MLVSWNLDLVKDNKTMQPCLADLVEGAYLEAQRLPSSCTGSLFIKRRGTSTSMITGIGDISLPGRQGLLVFLFCLLSSGWV